MYVCICSISESACRCSGNSFWFELLYELRSVANSVEVALKRQLKREMRTRQQQAKAVARRVCLANTCTSQKNVMHTHTASIYKLNKLITLDPVQVAINELLIWPKKIKRKNKKKQKTSGVWLINTKSGHSTVDTPKLIHANLMARWAAGRGRAGLSRGLKP